VGWGGWGFWGGVEEYIYNLLLSIWEQSVKRKKTFNGGGTHARLSTIFVSVRTLVGKEGVTRGRISLRRVRATPVHVGKKSSRRNPSKKESRFRTPGSPPQMKIGTTSQSLERVGARGAKRITPSNKESGVLKRKWTFTISG